MKTEFIQNNNVANMLKGIDALKNRSAQTPGLGLIYGRAGLGKSEAVSWYDGDNPTIFVRALRNWTACWMMQDIVSEMGIAPENSTRKVFEQLVKALSNCKTPIIVDEGDYLINGTRMPDTLRDVHDITKTPIIIIGEEQITAKLINHRRFWSRISQIIEFQPQTAPEITLTVKNWTGLQIEPAAAEALCRETEGNFRLISVALEHLEKAALASKSPAISCAIVEAVGKKLSFKSHLAKRSK